MGKNPYFPSVKSTWRKAQEYNTITTPSNPDSSKYKLYFKSDGKLYKLDSSGTETEIGGTSGASADDEITINNVTLKLKEWVLM